MEIAERLAATGSTRGMLAKNLAILSAALLAGFLIFSIDVAPLTFLGLIFGAAGAIRLVMYPEIGLALYVVVGDLKGDERISSLLPVDLTLVLAGVLAAGIALNWVRGRRPLPLPWVFIWYVPLVALMIASLAYTPVFDAGLEKIGRFVTVTAVVILAPFFVLTTLRAMTRFLLAYGVLALAICGYSLTELGGSGRLATPSNFTIGLGHIACALIVLIWFGVIPRAGFGWRLCVYPLLGVPFMALVGAGSRGPLIALALAIACSLVLFRKLFLDLGVLAALGAAALPWVHIPEASLDYLGTLVQCRDVSMLMSFRHELFDQGWKILQQHPLLGVGIEGFRFSSPNAGLYNWPHNIFLEIACELGIPALLMACAIFSGALREAWCQLRDRTAPYFSLSLITAGLLLVGIVNSTNTGDINSDRSTWLVVSLVFVMRWLRNEACEPAVVPAIGVG